jgi:hypothetical protein
MNKSAAGITVEHTQLLDVMNQADYPISHSMLGHGPFDRTRRLIIETPNLNYSRYVADTFMGRPQVREWIENYQAGIIITELQSGKTGKTVAAEQYI